MKSKKIPFVFLLVFVAISLQSQQTEKPVRPVNVKPDTSVADSKPAHAKPVIIDSSEILKKKLDDELKKTAATSERIEKKVEKIPPMINQAMYKLIISSPSRPKQNIVVAPITTKELPVNVSDPKIDTAGNQKVRRSFFRFKRNRE
ncbi:MAG TPA: hypothetical protein VGN64_11365 [Dyadobacter sp.]|jgi:Skp family chaperone for outer membrane proteins|nr:hypothetical protein [Dyadobacter sp.]